MLWDEHAGLDSRLGRDSDSALVLLPHPTNHDKSISSASIEERVAVVLSIEHFQQDRHGEGRFFSLSLSLRFCFLQINAS